MSCSTTLFFFSLTPHDRVLVTSHQVGPVQGGFCTDSVREFQRLGSLLAEPNFTSTGYQCGGKKVLEKIQKAPEDFHTLLPVSWSSGEDSIQ